MRLCGENRRNIFQQTENTGKEHLMRQKTFGKWLAAAGTLIVMTIWMVLPALAAPTVNSIRITFKDKYEDPGVIEEPEISCSSSLSSAFFRYSGSMRPTRESRVMFISFA